MNDGRGLSEALGACLNWVVREGLSNEMQAETWRQPDEAFHTEGTELAKVLRWELSRRSEYQNGIKA